MWACFFGVAVLLRVSFFLLLFLWGCLQERSNQNNQMGESFWSCTRLEKAGCPESPRVLGRSYGKWGRWGGLGLHKFRTCSEVARSPTTMLQKGKQGSNVGMIPWQFQALVASVEKHQPKKNSHNMRKHNTRKTALSSDMPCDFRHWHRTPSGNLRGLNGWFRSL